MFQKQYSISPPWAALAGLAASSLGFVLFNVTRPWERNTVGYYINNTITAILLVVWCFAIVQILACLLLKPKITVTDDSITLPSLLLPGKYILIPYDKVQSIRALRSAPQFRAPPSPARLLIRFANKEYGIGQGVLSPAAFFECTNGFLESIQPKRSDLVEECLRASMALPPLKPPHKTNRILIGILVVLLIPVVLLGIILILGSLLGHH